MSRILAISIIGILTNNERCPAQDRFDVRGFVREVDAKLGTITLGLANNGGLQSYSLASPDLPVRDARGNSLKLQDVKPGRKVTLSIVGSVDVAAIAIAPSFKVGKILQVNAVTREVELLVKKEKLRFTLAKDAHYYRSDRIVAPLDFRLGERITVYYVPENNEVLVVNYKNLNAGS